MSLRGQTAIVGYGEIPHRRRYENRSYMGLFADAVAIALKNAGELPKNSVGISKIHLKA